MEVPPRDSDTHRNGPPIGAAARGDVVFETSAETYRSDQVPRLCGSVTAEKETASQRSARISYLAAVARETPLRVPTVSAEIRVAEIWFETLAPQDVVPDIRPQIATTTPDHRRQASGAYGPIIRAASIDRMGAHPTGPKGGRNIKDGKSSV